MSFAQTLSTYITLNLLIALSALALLFFSMILRISETSLESKKELRLHYAILSLVILFTVIHPFLPHQEVLQPAAKIWSEPTSSQIAKDPSLPSASYLSFSAISEKARFSTNALAGVWGLLAFVLIAVSAALITRDLRRLLLIKRNSFLVKQKGRLHVYVNEDIKVPFSYWLPGQANVVMPSSLLAKTQDYKIALAHEIQHHRQGDTKWIYLIWGLRILCVANPFMAIWSRWLSEIQEFACDETLVDRKKVESQAYARCLFEVAQTAIDQKYVPACATGLAFLVERQILKRRIEKMLNPTMTKTRRTIGLSFMMILASLMAVTAFAARDLIQDRRVTMAQATNLAEKAQAGTTFPIVVNDLVLKHLNYFVGTPEGRETMRQALQRMENYRPMIEGAIRSYRHPIELMAIPLVESGYQNLPESNRKGVGAGLWMFIASTARVFGMEVSDKKDERLNVPKETDAAMRYLGMNYLRFKDWQLSLMAYNMGENGVQKAIDETGSRDAWELIRKGYEGDRGYLAKVMAAVIVMKNPDSLD